MKSVRVYWIDDGPNQAIFETFDELYEFLTMNKDSGVDCMIEVFE